MEMELRYFRGIRKRLQDGETIEITSELLKFLIYPNLKMQKLISFPYIHSCVVSWKKN